MDGESGGKDEFNFVSLSSHLPISPSSPLPLSTTCDRTAGFQTKVRTIANTGKIETDDIEARSDNLRFTTHHLNNCILKFIDKLDVYGPGVGGIIRKSSIACDRLHDYTVPTHSPWLVAFVSGAGKITLKSISTFVRLPGRASGFRNKKIKKFDRLQFIQLRGDGLLQNNCFLTAPYSMRHLQIYLIEII